MSDEDLRRVVIDPVYRLNRHAVSTHSLANVAEAWKGVTHSSRRLSMTSQIRLSAGNVLDYASKNETLESIQIAVIQLFQRKKLQEGELAVLQETLRNLIKSDAGPLIFDYYKDKLLKKGMVILREGMKNDLGSVLLKKMGEQWSYLQCEILPTLQAMFYPLPTKDTSIRKATLLEFRDVVVLKVGIEESLGSVLPDEVPAAIRQMFLVLLSVHDGSPPTENYARLERLAARVISPYLGFFGLYEGSSTPVVKTSLKPATRLLQTEKTEAYDLDTRPSRPKSANIPSLKSPHNRLGNGHNLFSNHFLAPVREQDSLGGRRHSIQT
ncbi:proline-rich protein 5-like isoform X1 [Ylistrum balloti]|uniref:proline-rich protein 5-like isoform X1 n=1 Tax=Ylistrum balloti TaxID=509963 RepID=UPI002905CD58|nr:proline-rich protein 5-like isoform X1 [Ylistrum balloti]